MVLDGKSSQGYPVINGVPQGSILGPTFFILHISDLPDEIICYIGKSSQGYPVINGVPQGSILGPTFFILHISDLPDEIICYIAIYADDTTPYFDCDQASDLCWLLNLSLTYERLVGFSAGKSQHVLFDHSNKSGAIDVKMDRSVIEEKSSFKMLGLLFFSKLY